MNRPEAARTPLQSSLLSSIHYSIDATLELEFHSGAIYRYFNRNVRSRFPYHRLA